MNIMHQPGFSLIELILVILVVTAASVPILGQFSQVASSSLTDEEIQTASQLAQERAEEILAIRRSQGFAAITLGTTNVNLTGKYSSYSRRVTVTDPSTSGACLYGATCKNVVVSVNRGSVKRAEIAYTLVDD